MKINSKYILNNDFNDNNNKVYNLMNKLYINSLERYLNSYSDNRTILKGLSTELNFILETVQTIENYLYANIDNMKFESIMVILERINYICIKENIFNVSTLDTDSLYITNNFVSDENLSGDERNTISLIRQIELLINNKWLNQVRYNLSLDELAKKSNIYDGLEVISLVTAQERAEEYFYNSIGKERKESQFMQLPYDVCKTNLDSFGQYETPVMWFGATLNGLGCLETPKEVIESLSKKALDSNFYTDVIEEYKLKNNLNELWLILTYLGHLKSNTLFNKSLECVSEVLVPLRDYDKPKQKVKM